MTAVSFPSQLPPAYRMIEGEPRFDPARHLALEPPARIWTLAEFGYSPDVIASTPSPIAAAGPFRVLSQEGVAALREVCLALRGERISDEGGLRTSSYVAGAVYRSTFVRDLCASPEVARLLSKIAGTALVPHTMPSQQAYINYAPDDISKAVDNWHMDSIGFDYVLMLSDPARLVGGKFQFFKGTAARAAQLLGTTSENLTRGFVEALPDDLVETIVFPAAGYGVFQQGHLVLHRATRLEQPGERITLVPGYVTADASKPDPTIIERMVHYGEPGILMELARHAAWRTQVRLASMIRDLPATEDPAAVRKALAEASADLQRVMAALDTPAPAASETSAAST